MSYILDALKKSEKKRQHGTVPDLLTVHDTMPQKPKNRLIWPYFLLVALLINAGILVWLLSPWQSKKTNIIAQSTSENQLGSKAPDSNSPELLKTNNLESRPTKKISNDVQQNQPLQNKADLLKKVPDNPIPTIDTKGTHEISPMSPQQTQITDHFISEPQPNTHTGVITERRVYNLSELPLSIQQSLPAFSISTLIYSNDPTSRLVKINGQLIREGQDLAAGLKLEEIAQDGIILNYQNYRFRIGLK